MIRLLFALVATLLTWAVYLVGFAVIIGWLF